MPITFLGMSFALFAAGIYIALLHRRISSQKSALEQLQRVLERESMIDEATGLLNHRQLETEIEREIERAKRYKRSLSGIILAIDDYETIKTSRGTAMGLAALKKTATVIQSCIRKVDITGRLGEAVFVILLPEGLMDGTRTVAQRIQDKIRGTHIELPRPGLTISVSIGLFAFPDCGFIDKKLLLETAEVSLLKAIKEGKDRLTTGQC